MTRPATISVIEIVVNQGRRILGIRRISAFSVIRRISTGDYYGRRASPRPPCGLSEMARIVLIASPCGVFLSVVSRARPRNYRFVQVDLPVAYLEVVPAVGNCAYPRLVMYGRPLTAKIRKWYQDSCRAGLAQWKVVRFQLLPLPFLRSTGPQGYVAGFRTRSNLVYRLT